MGDWLTELLNSRDEVFQYAQDKGETGIVTDSVLLVAQISPWHRYKSHDILDADC